MLKKRLLVIEDDVDVAELLITYFTSQGFEVFNAMNGEDGISMARAKFPNIILLDVMLPDIDGFDVCKALRTTTLTKYIPIMFLTQRDRRADKVAGLELGADDYITKPFDLEELRLRVQAALKRATRDHLQDPHTGLPSRVVIDEVREDLLRQKGCTVLDIRVVGLNMFRDRYSFVAADEALNYIGQVISESLSRLGTPQDFAGTLREDHYVIFTFAPDAIGLMNELKKRFDTNVRAFYNFQDRERGYVMTNEGSADEHYGPLMQFNIRALSNSRHDAAATS